MPRILIIEDDTDINNAARRWLLSASVEPCPHALSLRDPVQILRPGSVGDDHVAAGLHAHPGGAELGDHAAGAPEKRGPRADPGLLGGHRHGRGEAEHDPQALRHPHQAGRRDEEAIRATDAKYGSFCHRLAMNILHSFQDSEECVSDTYGHGKCAVSIP